MQKISQFKIGHAYSLIATVLGSVYYVLYKQLLETITVAQFVYLLFIFSFIFNLVFFYRPSKPLVFSKDNLITAIGFSLLSILGNLMVGEALLVLHPAVTVVIQRTQIFFVIILTYIFLQDKLKLKVILGAIISITGIIIIQNKTNPNWNFENLGVIWSLIAAVCFGASQVLVKKMINKITPHTVNIFRLFLALILMSLNPSLWKNWTDLSSIQWLIIIICGLIGPTFARLLLFYSLRTISAAESVLFTMLTPVFVMGIMSIFKQQHLSKQELIGGVILLVGVTSSLIPWKKLFQKK